MSQDIRFNKYLMCVNFHNVCPHACLALTDLWVTTIRADSPQTGDQNHTCLPRHVFVYILSILYRTLLSYLSKCTLLLGLIMSSNSCYHCRARRDYFAGLIGYGPVVSTLNNMEENHQMLHLWTWWRESSVNRSLDYRREDIHLPA